MYRVGLCLCIRTSFTHNLTLHIWAHARAHTSKHTPAFCLLWQFFTSTVPAQGGVSTTGLWRHNQRIDLQISVSKKCYHSLHYSFDYSYGLFIFLFTYYYLSFHIAFSLCLHLNGCVCQQLVSTRPVQSWKSFELYFYRKSFASALKDKSQNLLHNAL